MSIRLHTVVETTRFLRDAEQVGIGDEERRLIVDALAYQPAQGDEVKGSGGVRKVRVAGPGRGKSGGYRVMTAYVGPDVPVYLLAVLSKGDRANFTQAEIIAMKGAITSIKRVWKQRR